MNKPIDEGSIRQAAQPDRNPYHICTVGDPAVCAECELADKLKCRFQRSDLLHFTALFTLIAIPAGIGLVHGGYAWALVGWVAFSMFFFNVWESRILCRHCPYYAERGRILHCIANYGIFKPFRFNPAPMSRGEKAQLSFAFALLLLVLLAFLVAAGEWVMLFLTIWGTGVWLFTMQKYVCSACVNFSCPLNRVPKPIVDAYLKRNPAMRQAWEFHGWRVE